MDAIEFGNQPPRFYGITEFLGRAFGAVLCVVAFCLGLLATTLSAISLNRFRNAVPTTSLLFSIGATLVSAGVFCFGFYFK
ncbi:MAG: hypothetical protein CMJ78_07355 [Planctomycetaceae bacterium]|nr:hypothetical protein [Planctomycetaceae bacterium]